MQSCVGRLENEEFQKQMQMQSTARQHACYPRRENTAHPSHGRLGRHACQAGKSCTGSAAAPHFLACCAYKNCPARVSQGVFASDLMKLVLNSRNLGNQLRAKRQGVPEWR